MRLIDLDDVIEVSMCDEETEEWSAKKMTVEALLSHYAEVPLVVDIVKCEECKWWNEHFRECQSPYWNTGTNEHIIQPAGMYCGWGDKK